MKRVLSNMIFLAAFAVAGMQLPACKDKAKESTTESTTTTTLDTATTAAPTVEPPVINTSDDSLTTALNDAVKDYPGVKATADNSEVTLTGTVSRASLPKLMMAVNALHPKKINNNLTIK